MLSRTAQARRNPGVSAAAVGKRLLETDPANPLTARLLAIAFNKAGVAAQAERYAKETDRLLAGDGSALGAPEADLRRLGE